MVSRSKTPAKAPGLKVETWPTDRLAEYARNPRRNDHAVDRMVEAIKEFGFRIPIVAKSDGEVVDGHLRLKAARKMGLREVPVALADDLSPRQIKAFRLLANRSASWAEWDDALLRMEMSELKGITGFDLSMTGFDLAEIDDILKGGDAQPPEGFTRYDEDIETEHECPRCHYVWSGGKSRPVESTAEEETAA